LSLPKGKDIALLHTYITLDELPWSKDCSERYTRVHAYMDVFVCLFMYK